MYCRGLQLQGNDNKIDFFDFMLEFAEIFECENRLPVFHNYGNSMKKLSKDAHLYKQ
jgi:hypothetical protein